jgi:hypothetical protein
MHRQREHLKKIYILATEIISVVRILVEANSDCVSTQQQLACLYNRQCVCLLCGTN